MEENYTNMRGLEGIAGRLTMRVNGGLTQEQQDAIVDAHNEHRADVDPPAADMKKMVICPSYII